MLTHKESFLEQLRKQSAAENGVNRQKVLAEWLDSLRSLMDQLRQWLSDAEAGDLFRVETNEVEREEKQHGAYKAPEVRIIPIGGDVIHIIPVARYVVGAHGRVDLKCLSNKASLVQTAPHQWQFATLEGSRGWVMKDLNEENFWEVLETLVH